MDELKNLVKPYDVNEDEKIKILDALFDVENDEDVDVFSM